MIELLRAATLISGELVRKAQATGGRVVATQKHFEDGRSGDFATAADEASNRFLLGFTGTLRPDLQIITEESSKDRQLPKCGYIVYDDLDGSHDLSEASLDEVHRTWADPGRMR